MNLDNRDLRSVLARYSLNAMTRRSCVWTKSTRPEPGRLGVEHSGLSRFVAMKMNGPDMAPPGIRRDDPLR